MLEEELETGHDEVQLPEEDAGNHEMGEVDAEEANHDGFQTQEEPELESEFIEEELKTGSAF